MTIDGTNLTEVYRELLRRQLGDRAAGGISLRRPAGGEHRLGRPTHLAEVRAAAEQRGLAAVGRPAGRYDTELGERGHRLLGQRQLVASCARALLADPRILILDEATSSVDIGTERQIERAPCKLLAGRRPS